MSDDKAVERDVLRRAAAQFERGFEAWRREPDGTDRDLYLHAHRYAADVLATWAMNDGVPTAGSSRDEVTECAPEVPR